MQELKQATTVTVPIGPFVTSDGTAVTGLTISIADVRMFYNGASAVAKVDSVEPTHNELGFYLCEFNHTDTSALGMINVAITETGALPVFHDFAVVTANNWDTKYGADYFDVNLVADQSGATIGTVQSLSAVGTVTDGAQASTVTGVAQASTMATMSGNVDDIETNYAQASTVAGVAQASVLAALNNITAADVWSDTSGASVLNTVNATDANFPLSVVAAVTGGAQASELTAVKIATGVWNANVSTYNAAGGFGLVFDDTIEEDSGAYRFTATALSEAPTGGSGDATVAAAVWSVNASANNAAGTIGKVFDDMTEDSGGTYRYTAASIAEAPTGGGTDASVAAAVWVYSAGTAVAQASTVAGVAQASALATVSGNVDDIETNYAQASTVAGVAQASTATAILTDTAEIGAAGAGLSAVPWNASWDTEVESEVTDSLVAHNLDHLLLTATDSADMTGEVADNTILSRMLANGDTSVFDPSTDGMQPTRDAITAAGDVLYSPDASSTCNTGTETNDYTDAAAAGNDVWTIGDENGDSGAIHSATSDYTIDVIAEFNMGSNRTANQLDIVGYFEKGGASPVVEIYAYNYVTPGWDKLSVGTATTEMRDNSSNQSYTFNLLAAYTDLVTTPGEVKIGFVIDMSGATANGSVLYLDYIGVAGAAVGGTTPQAIAAAVHTELDEHFIHMPMFTGEIHYVSKSGNDSNNGHSPETSFLTVAAAITASLAGDRIIVKAGTYDENGLDMALKGLELMCEIGVIFRDTTPGTVLAVSTSYCYIENLTLEAATAQTAISVTGSFCRMNDVHPRANGATSFAIAGEHNVFVRCRADNYSTNGYNITAGENIFDQCIAYGDGSTRGFYFSDTAAHENIMNACITINNDTAGIEYVSGADLNATQAHASIAETTPYTDSGADNVFTINTDYAQTNVIQVNGTSQTANDNGADINTLLDNYAQASTVTGVAQASSLATISGNVDDIETGYAQASTVAGVAQASSLATVSGNVDDIETNYAQASTVAGVAQASSLAALGPAKNVEMANFPFFMVKSSDHVTPLTSVSPVGYIKKDAGALASLTNAVAEVSSYGMYVVTMTSTEMNADRIALVFTAAGADQVGITIITT